MGTLPTWSSSIDNTQTGGAAGNTGDKRDSGGSSCSATPGFCQARHLPGLLANRTESKAT